MGIFGRGVRLPVSRGLGVRHRLINHSFALSVVLLVFGCGYPEPPKVVTISSAASFRPSSPREIRSVEQALAAIVTVCRDDLKLPVVQSFQAKLYRNSQSFASFGFDWRAFPVDVADITAFADGTKIHIDLQKAHGDSGWALLTWLLAHEYGHTIHYEIAGVIPQTDPWFNEGFAEWVAAKTFDALGWQDYRLSIHRVETEAARYLHLLPPLADLRDSRTWHRISGFTYGRIRTYSLALLAVDRLIQRGKRASAVELLSANIFNESFGSSYDDFHRDLLNHLPEHKGPLNDDEVYDSPRWKAGDKWTYELRRPGQKVIATKEFIGKDTFAGIPSYVLKSGAEESLYAIDSLALVASKTRGRYTYRVSNIDQAISWPLKANKQWQNSFTRENSELSATRSSRFLMRAVGSENIEVKAGRLRTLKIEAYGYSIGRLLAEYWYSPEAKWFAKSRLYDRDFGLVEEELLNFEKAE